MDIGVEGSHEIMNGEITGDEVRNVVNNAKLKKSFGIDYLPNEVFKNEPLLHRLFSFYFKYSIVPSLWQTTVSRPIPHSGMKDFCDPMNDYGIVLAVIESKLYTALLTNQLTKFREKMKTK